MKFEIPILVDVKNCTALDICLGVDKANVIRRSDTRSFYKRLKHKLSTKLCKKTAELSENEASSNNLMLVGLILDNIKDNGLLHSSPQIIDAVIKATELGIPEIKGYLESRIRTAEHPHMRFS